MFYRQEMSLFIYNPPEMIIAKTTMLQLSKVNFSTIYTKLVQKISKNGKCHTLTLLKKLKLKNCDFLSKIDLFAFPPMN